MVFLFLLCTNVISHLLVSLFQFRAPPGNSLVCLSYLQNHVWDQVDHIAHLEAMGQPMRGMIHIASWDRVTPRAQGTLLEESHTVICRAVRVQSGGGKPWQHTSYTKPSMNPQDWRLCCFSASPLSPSFAALAQDTWINCAEDLRMPDCGRPVYIWTGFINMHLSCVVEGEDEHVLLTRFATLSCIFTPYLAPLNQILACLPLWFPSGAEKAANKPKKNNNSPKHPDWHRWLRATFKWLLPPPQGRLKVKTQSEKCTVS